MNFLLTELTEIPDIDEINKNLSLIEKALEQE